MKAAAKTQKPKRQEEHANFISWRFALLCGCILLALAFDHSRVERIATEKLQMQHVDPSQENIVVQK